MGCAWLRLASGLSKCFEVQVGGIIDAVGG